jgi:predicted RNA-binding Zn-ribbon protein involved in translation (DUF1610 family)
VERRLMIRLFLRVVEMPKCPKCGEEISCLLNYKYTSSLIFTLSLKNGEPDYDLTDEVFPDVTDEGDFVCPQCGELLFTNEKEAVAFLSK